jgi:hypothetical protein
VAVTPFTFTGNLDTALDRVRSAIGDVYAARGWLPDNTILALIAGTSTEVWAAVKSCEAIVSRVASQTDFTNASLTKAAGQLMAHYTELSERLTRQAASSTSLLTSINKPLPIPVFGGLTWSGENRLRQDTDAKQPPFAVGSDDIRGGPSPEALNAWWNDPLRGL